MSGKDRNGGGFALRDGSTDSAAVEQYYDAWAEGYDAALDEWQYRAPEEAAARLAARLSPGAKVLDAGCGTGRFGAALARQAEVTLTGLDLSAASLEQARARGVYASLARHDLQDLPLPVAEASLDAAASIGVLTYIEEAAPLLADIGRAIRPGGWLIFTQRSDLWQTRGGPAMLDALARDAGLDAVEVTAPRPYLPGNAEFGDEIGVIYVTCRKT
ncbi:class I SAM-dependent DNA methyltransferase [Roseivivax sp. CAU 1761]